ncbi:hypothetical protein G7074_11065 [Pedobacter sp. HDW13]|uniref:hypothetical protein n=1 Tax=unclassified Pedobacter TaxID=2628915 RepID=UPI000F591273|nr:MULTISPECIES: hypothetical protein [unclassified Pedobacter]QIL39757.1 hypothetical protein G7074_11065 [Pedobacter sp. HDW13]RQO79758.1 hypothetical protein DBR40_02035 [Pedobacter sp. KBW01]
MKKIFLSLAVLFFYIISATYGQKSKNKVYQTFTAADSVIIVSHTLTYTQKISEDDYSPRLIENGKLNQKIIKQTLKLDKKDIDLLASILIMPLKIGETFESGRCFMPHHGILIYKQDKCSFFDICFDCKHFVTSNDIKLSDSLRIITWQKLKAFFKSRKLDYQIPMIHGKEE